MDGIPLAPACSRHYTMLVMFSFNAMEVTWWIVGMANVLGTNLSLTNLSTTHLMLHSSSASRLVYVLTTVLSISAVVAS